MQHSVAESTRKFPPGPPERSTKPQDPPPGYLTVAELCEELVISERTAYYLLSKGDIPHVRAGRSIRVYRTTLDKWRREQEEASKKKAPPRRKVEANDPKGSASGIIPN